MYKHPDNGLILAPFNTIQEAIDHFNQHGHFLRELPGNFPVYPKLNLDKPSMTNNRSARGKNWYPVDEEYRIYLPMTKNERQKTWPCDFEGNLTIKPAKVARWPDGTLDIVQTAIAFDTNLKDLYKLARTSQISPKVHEDIEEALSLRNKEQYLEHPEVLYAIYLITAKNNTIARDLFKEILRKRNSN